MMSGRQETAGDYRLCPREPPDTASYQTGRKEAECVNTAPHTSLIRSLMDEDAQLSSEREKEENAQRTLNSVSQQAQFFCSETTTRGQQHKSLLTDKAPSTCFLCIHGNGEDIWRRHNDGSLFLTFLGVVFVMLHCKHTCTAMQLITPMSCLSHTMCQRCNHQKEKCLSMRPWSLVSLA